MTALAAWLPARRAVRLDLLEAIAAEREKVSVAFAAAECRAAIHRA